MAFGGGRRKFLSNETMDFYEKKTGQRIDGRNLIDEWIKKMESNNLKHKFLWNLTDFQNLKPLQYDHILGIFKLR